MTTGDPLLDIHGVTKYLSLSRATIYRAIKERGFPGPVPLGYRLSRWRRSEIDAWVDAQAEAARVTPAA